MLEYYGRYVGVKIMPTGVQPQRLLDGLQWEDTLWRRGELEVRCGWLAEKFTSFSLHSMYHFVFSGKFSRHSPQQLVLHILSLA